MSNETVLKNFLNKKHGQTNLRDIINGYYTYKGRTLHTEEDKDHFKLINYSTVIAYIKDNKLYLNVNKYSTTTSKIQSKLYYLASLTDYKIIRYYERGQ